MLVRDIKEILYVKLTGHVDQDVLDVLRVELGLERCGRLDDGCDDLFGGRQLRPAEQGEYYMELCRDVDNDHDSDWSVTLYAEPPYPSKADVLVTEERVFDAARKARLGAEEVYLHHVH